MANEKSNPVVEEAKPVAPVVPAPQMGTHAISVEPIIVPAFVKQHNKGFSSEQHYALKEEITYPQMHEKGLAPLVRVRGVTAETLNELGIEVPKVQE